MGGIIWQKVTTCKTTGGATVMGSYPYPRGGIIKIDYGLAKCDRSLDFQYKDRFIKYEEEAIQEKLGIWEEKRLVHA